MTEKKVKEDYLYKNNHTSLNRSSETKSYNSIYFSLKKEFHPKFNIDRATNLKIYKF